MINIIIPVAGKGSRLGKITTAYPKAMMPVNNIPLLKHIIDSIENRFNTQNIIVVKSKGQEIDLDVQCVDQENLNGPLGAIDAALPLLKENVPTLILLGDVIFSDETISNVFKTPNRDVLTFSRGVDDTNFNRYCLINMQGDKLYDKPEVKPEGTIYALSGVYLLQDTKKMIDVVTKVMHGERGAQDEYQLSQLLVEYIKDRREYMLFESKQTDVGTLEELKKVNVGKITREKNEFEFKLSTIKKSSKSSKLIKEAYHMKALHEQFPDLIPETNVVFGKHGDNEYYQHKIRGQTLEHLYLYEEEELTWYFEEIFGFIKNTFYTETPEQHAVINYLTSRGCFELAHYLDTVCLNKVFTHGDLHLANIISEDNNMKLVDASGSFFHSKYYDLAKMIHSFYNYNLVKNNLFLLEGNEVTFMNKHLKRVETAFMDSLYRHFNKEEIRQAKILTMIMFKSIIPCHNDNKLHQRVFLAIHKALKKEIDADNFDINKMDGVSLCD